MIRVKPIKYLREVQRFLLLDNLVSSVLGKVAFCVLSYVVQVLLLHRLLPISRHLPLPVEVIIRVLRPRPSSRTASYSGLEEGLAGLRVEELVVQAPRVLDVHPLPVLTGVHAVA